MSQPLLVVDNLHVSVEGKEILTGMSLTVNAGEVHVLMGPNGSGKSTLAFCLMGHPKYEITSGTMRFKGEEVAGLSPDARAKKGLFLAFQYPTAIPGVTIANFLRAAMRGVRGADVPIKEYRATIKGHLKTLGVSTAFMNRYVNDGFSGGEKKRLEILQMAVLNPALAVLDETDSGLDIDALKTVANGINTLRSPERGMLLITHYQRLLDYVKPDTVHVMVGGRLVRSGGPELALELESKGYEGFRLPAAPPARAAGSAAGGGAAQAGPAAVAAGGGTTSGKGA